MERKYNKISKETVFKFLCDIESNENYSGMPISIQYIMDSLLSSKHQITKYIHELRNEGLVELASIYFNPKTNQRESKINSSSVLLKGWILSQEGKKTVTYMESTQKSSNMSLF